MDPTPHLPALRRYARALTRSADDADDLVQDAVVRALAKAHLFQKGTDLQAWLMTILHNAHVNGVRTAVRRGTAVADPEAVLAAIPDDRATDPTDRIALREVAAAIALLPPNHRRILLRIALLGGDDDRSYAAAAAAEGIPIGTVRSRLSRSRAFLRAVARGSDLSTDEARLLSNGHERKPLRFRRIDG